MRGRFCFCKAFVTVEPQTVWWDLRSHRAECACVHLSQTVLLCPVTMERCMWSASRFTTFVVTPRESLAWES